MGKFIDADRLRAKIERRIDKLNPKTGMFGDRPLRDVNPKTFPRENELEKVLDLIDYLQQEQPEVDLKKEIDRIWNPRFNLGWDEYSALSLNHEGFVHIARHFARWGAEHTPLPEDTVLFNKGVEEGKRLMMEDAVEGEVCILPGGVAYVREQHNEALKQYILDNFKTGDKVRIIIVKD